MIDECFAVKEFRLALLFCVCVLLALVYFCTLLQAEEKMRVLYDRKCEQLKRLSERGEEAHKLEAVQTLIRKLSTKIKVAIQIVDSIANKISKLRDDELWPQISELIQGYVTKFYAR